MNLFQVRAVKLDDETPNQAPHIHNEYEIFCFLAGDAMYSVEGTIYRLNPGDILVMKNTEIHNLTLKKKPHINESLFILSQRKESHRIWFILF